MEKFKWPKVALVAIISISTLVGCEFQENKKEKMVNVSGCDYLLGELPAEHLTWQDFPEFEQTDAFHLAMESDRTLFPSEETILAIQNDLQQIRSQYSTDETTTSSVMPCANSSLLIGMSDEAFSKVKNDSYSTWQNINERFGVSEVKTLNNINVVNLNFKRFYNGPILRTLYENEGLDGVEYIDIDSYFGGSQDICMEENNNGERTYVFWQGSGDCPAGCINHRFSGYRIDADNSIYALGTFDRYSSEDDPDWFESLKHCPSQL